VQVSGSAACPLGIATAPMPSPRLAIRSSKAATAGLPMRIPDPRLRSSTTPSV